jgi:hypothetical protein
MDLLGNHLFQDLIDWNNVQEFEVIDGNSSKLGNLSKAG